MRPTRQGKSSARRTRSASRPDLLVSCANPQDAAQPRLQRGQLHVARAVEKRGGGAAKYLHERGIAPAGGELVLVAMLPAQEIEHLVALLDRVLDRVAEQHRAGPEAGKARLEARLHEAPPVAHVGGIRA